MELDLGSWDHDLFRSLRHHLQRCREDPILKNVQTLQRELEQARPWLAHLSSIPGPSDEAKRYIQSSESFLFKWDTQSL